MITRAQIPSVTITSVTFMVSGTLNPGDLGAGAIYTSNGATPTGCMAIQDAVGTWFNIVLSEPIVDVGWFGAMGNGSTDDTAAIQLAIDCAYNHDIATIHMPAGRYRITNTIWLDAPNNARVNWANPPNFNFSLRLVGDGWGGSENPGTHLQADNGSGAQGLALAVGPGQYMGVKGISVDGPMPANNLRCNIQVNSMGITVLTCGGGAHATTIEDCNVTNYYRAYSVGMNHDTMGDSNTLVRCSTNTVVYGFHANNSQNFINSLLDCTFYLFKVGVYSQWNLPINVLGGNFSTPWAPHGAMAFSTVGGWSYDTTNGRFPVHIDSGDTNIDAYDVFCIVTENIGIVPLTKYSWDNNTKILVLQMNAEWAMEYLGVSNWLFIDQTFFSMYDIVNALSPKYVYGGERITTFGSAGVYAKGVHMESFNSVNLIAHATAGWSASRHIKLEDCLLNWGSNGGLGLRDSEEFAIWALQSAWPGMDADVSLVTDRVDSPDQTRWRLRGGTGTSYRSKISSRTAEPTMSIKGPLAMNYPVDNDHYALGDGLGYGLSAESEYKGGGDFDNCPAIPGVAAHAIDGYQSQNLAHINGISRSPYVGSMPAPWVIPRLTPAMLDRLLGVLPALTGGNIPYDPVCGETIYQVVHSFNEAEPRDLFVRFHHKFWSWGQDLNFNWHYNDGTMCLYVDTAGLDYLFPGLYISLGPNPWEKAIITEVYRDLGYAIMQYAATTTAYRVLGGKGGSVSGTVIGQEPYTVTKIGNLKGNALTDANIAGKRFYVGDIIWQKTPVGSGSMGWICTTAGVAGAGAVFKDMPNLGA